MDCMDFIRDKPDNYYDLAIVDPPYFKELGNPKGYYGNKEYSNTGIKRSKFKKFEHWKVPDHEYFNELFRVSKEQIIWGCNYYAKFIPHVGRIVWDKINDSSSFSKCEIASKSKGIGIDIFRFMWNGMLQQNMKHKEERIHPTQKPVQLYRWLLQKYAKPRQLILDTHGGSMSSAIACDMEGFDLDIIELDKEYFEQAVKRFNVYKSQLKLF